MIILPSTDSIHEYIKEDDVIDYSNEIITWLADLLFQKADNEIIYPDPDIKVLEKLRKCNTRTELWDDLPTELGYVK
ncbi:MAG: hypothetical protein HDT40_06915 [Lachnospiraceae bacterium]|nr:hypothetical protein [Lachnospiraceae bacterium]